MAIRFMYVNLVDTADALSLTNVNANFPVSNVQNPLRGIKAKTISATSERLVIDFGSAKAVTALVIENHNFDSGGTYKWEANATDSWGSPSRSQALTYADNRITQFISSDSYRYQSILMTNVTNSIIEIGRISIGVYFEPTRNFDIDYKNTIIDPSSDRFTTSGQRYVDIKDQYEILDFEFKVPTASEKTNYETMMSAVGTFKNFFICLDSSDASATTYYGYTEKQRRFKKIIGDIWTMTMQFIEAL